MFTQPGLLAVQIIIFLNDIDDETPQMFPWWQQNTLCLVGRGIIFIAADPFQVYYSKFLTEENCCQGSHLSLSGGPWDTWHTEKFTMHPLLPDPGPRIGHLQLPLTFR